MQSLHSKVFPERRESTRLHKDLNINVRRNLICNAQRLEITQMSFNKGLGKQSVYSCTGMLLSYKKEQTICASKWMTSRCWVKEARQTLCTLWFYLHILREDVKNSSGRKQISGCLGVGVRREECEKHMGKLLGGFNVHYLDHGGGFMGAQLMSQLLILYIFHLCSLLCQFYPNKDIFLSKQENI